MTVLELCKAVDGTLVVEGDTGAQIDSYYAGDFLSRVMGKAPTGCAWFTIMANVNVAGVAVLAEIRAVVLCEGVRPDEALAAKCRAEGIALICTEKSTFACCRLV